MNYLGVDFHKLTSYVTRIDEKGKEVGNFSMRNTAENIREFAGSLSAEDKVAVEATGHWMYLYEQLEDSEAEFYLGHPQATKAIASARLKNDKVDSKMLAELLRCDLLPLSYIPPREVRDLRELLRLRSVLIRLRSMVKIRLRAILLKTGQDCPYSDILGKGAIKWMRALAVRECYLLGLDHQMRIGLQLSSQLAELEKVLCGCVQSNPDAELLMSMPGIGLYSALMILAEIGEINRFKYSDQLVSWAGMAPRIKQSSTHIRRGPITKQGSKYLRWILIEDAHHAIKKSKRFSSKYESVRKRRGDHKAKVAVATSMLRSIHWMLTHRESYKDIL